MENITYQIRFLILNDKNEVLKNFVLTEREYDTREEACEAAQTVCCVLTNYCGWDVFYRVVVPASAGGGTFHDGGEGHIVSDEKTKDEEENCSFDEIEDEDVDKFLAWMREYCKDKDEEEEECEEEENDSYDELTEKEVRAILRQAHDLVRKKCEDE